MLHLSFVKFEKPEKSGIFENPEPRVQKLSLKSGIRRRTIRKSRSSSHFQTLFCGHYISPDREHVIDAHRTKIEIRVRALGLQRSAKCNRFVRARCQHGVDQNNVTVINYERFLFKTK